MYSLLQRPIVETLSREEMSRKALLASLAVCGVSLLGCCALVPAYIASAAPTPWDMLMPHADHDISEAETGRRDPQTSAEAQDRAKQLLALVEEQLQSAGLTETLAFVRNKASERSDVHLIRVSAGQKVFLLAGSTKSRASLLSLLELFRKDARVSRADVPVSELAGRDGEFPFTITVTMRDETVVQSLKKQP